MRTNFFNKSAFCLSIIITSLIMLCSCNPDVTLNSNEDSPKIAEAILDMPVQEAMKYLEKNGFRFGSKADYSNEYVFSKDASLSEFSNDASIMLMFGTFEGDTVRYAAAMHRMQTEKSARDLYWKWSHFAATVIKPTFSYWSGHVSVKDLSISQQPDKGTYYCGGTTVEQMLKDRTDDYNNGKITKEEYDQYVEIYSKYNQSKFWADFKRETDNIDSAFEQYRNEDSTGHPKEIELNVYMNNGGEIELYYSTHNFVVHWI